MAKKLLKTRDHLMVKIINGATKSGPHKDRKKEANKKTARMTLTRGTCDTCSNPLPIDDYIEDSFDSLKFCSEGCQKTYNQDHSEWGI